MICHIDGFVYEKDWDNAFLDGLEMLKQAQFDYENDYEDEDEYEDLSDKELEELQEGSQVYYFTENNGQLSLPSFYDFIEELKYQEDGLFILWISDNDGSNPHYIAKGSADYLLGILDGVKVAANLTGVSHSIFNYDTVNFGLLTAENYLQINNYFNTEVF